MRRAERSRRAGAVAVQRGWSVSLCPTGPSLHTALLLHHSSHSPPHPCTIAARHSCTLHHGPLSLSNSTDETSTPRADQREQEHRPIHSKRLLTQGEHQQGKQTLQPRVTRDEHIFVARRMNEPSTSGKGDHSKVALSGFEFRFSTNRVRSALSLCAFFALSARPCFRFFLPLKSRGCELELTPH